MKKLVLTLALTAFIGASAAPAFACEGGKCKMEHADKAKKKKNKKATAVTEDCHKPEATAATADAGKTPACCMKKTEASKETKTTTETKTQK